MRGQCFAFHCSCRLCTQVYKANYFQPAQRHLLDVLQDIQKTSFFHLKRPSKIPLELDVFY